MKTVYVLLDWNDRESVHVFAHRRNAIQYAYEHCKAFEAPLFVTIKTWGISRPIWQYKNLADVVGDNDPIDYLNALSDKDVNDVFYDYYVLTEVTIDDMDNNGKDE